MNISMLMENYFMEDNNKNLGGRISDTPFKSNIPKKIPIVVSKSKWSYEENKVMTRVFEFSSHQDFFYFLNGVTQLMEEMSTDLEIRARGKKVTIILRGLAGLIGSMEKELAEHIDMIYAEMF
jgi:pterin-4a-carbinolamine dehydratase